MSSDASRANSTDPDIAAMNARRGGRWAQRIAPSRLAGAALTQCSAPAYLHALGARHDLESLTPMEVAVYRRREPRGNKAVDSLHSRSRRCACWLERVCELCAEEACMPQPAVDAQRGNALVRARVGRFAHAPPSIMAQ